jgi:hypothetical protein
VPVSSAQRAAFATALLVTTIELGMLFFVLSPRPRAVRLENPVAVAERVVFLAPAPPNARIAEPRATPSTRTTSVERPLSSPAAMIAMPRDSSFGSTPAPRVPAAPGSTPTPAGGGTWAGGATSAGPVLAPRGFNSSTPLTRHVIDSVLDSLDAFMPALIWARGPTPAERDAAYKESAMAIRLSGRTLLVPADPHLASGFRLPSVPLPPLRHKQRAAVRARSDSILAENMARLARLRVTPSRCDAACRLDSSRRLACRC